MTDQTQAPPPPATQAPPPPATQAPPPPATNDWVAGIADESTRTWVQNKGFKSAGDVALSALNLEKLLGAGVDKLVKIPVTDAPEEWAAVYDKLGRPKEAKEYGIKAPDGADGTFAEKAASWFHEAGLNPKQAQLLAGKYQEFATGMATEQTSAVDQKNAADMVALKAEWGPKYEANAALVDRAANELGMNVEHLKALKASMGSGAAMKFLHGLGAKLGTEGGFVRGDKGNGFQGVDAAGAAAKIQALKGDPAWVKRYTEGGHAENAEMTRLLQIKNGA